MAYDKLLALKITSNQKKRLEDKYPDSATRNNVIRALIQKLLEGKITVTGYELEINPT